MTDCNLSGFDWEACADKIERDGAVCEVKSMASNLRALYRAQIDLGLPPDPLLDTASRYLFELACGADRIPADLLRLMVSDMRRIVPQVVRALGRGAS
jgi:hypothetical protein